MPTSESLVNVLLTFAGEKSYLVEVFESSPRLGRLVAVDADARAAIAGFVPEFRAVPPVAEGEAYVDALAELCLELEIHLLLPQNDLDLEILANARDRFEAIGTQVAGASPEILRTVCDKLGVGSWLAGFDLAYPRTVAGSDPSSRTLGLPVIVKPRHGQSSEGLQLCSGPDDLTALPDDMVIQERLEGPEYHLDILRSEREVVAVIPKRKLAMRWGSTHRAMAVDSPELVDLGKRLGEAVAHVGSIDVDVIDTDRGPVVLDINPRIGGGFPFTSLFCPGYVDSLLAIGRGDLPAPFLGRYRSGYRASRELRFFEHPLSDTTAPRRIARS